MYYRSVTFLKLELHSLRKVVGVKKWLAEFDLAAYGTLPTIEFCPWWLENDPRSAIYVTRDEVCPAKELPFYISIVSPLLDSQASDQSIHDRALDFMYREFIGDREAMYEDFCPKAPEHFVQVVRNGGTWIRRRPHTEGLSRRCAVMAENEEVDFFKDKVVRIAAGGQGRDWDKRDLEWLVEWFECGVRALGR